MKFFDFILKRIFLIQFFFEKHDEYYLEIIEKYRLLYGVFIFLFISLYIKIILPENNKINYLFENISMILFVYLFLYKVDWRKSIRRLLFLLIVYNGFLSLVIVQILEKKINEKFYFLTFLLIYSIMWIFFCIIANSKIALLLNEIIAMLSASFFTTITFILGMLSKRLPNPNHYILYFNTQSIFEKELINGNPLAKNFLISNLVYLCDYLLLYLLIPIISITAFSFVIIKIKIYWLEKNNLKEL